MQIEGDYVIFSTGSVRYAQNGVLGLDPDSRVMQGYDGDFYRGEGEESWSKERPKLTTAELCELADYMIKRWQQFRASQEGVL